MKINFLLITGFFLIGLMMETGTLNCNDLIFNSLFYNKNIHYFGSLLNIGALFGFSLSGILSYFGLNYNMQLFISCLIGILGSVANYVLSFINYNNIVRDLLLMGRFCNGAFSGSFMTSFLCYILRSHNEYKSYCIGFFMNFGIFFGCFVTRYFNNVVDLYKFTIFPLIFLPILGLGCLLIVNGCFNYCKSRIKCLSLNDTEVRKSRDTKDVSVSIFGVHCTVDKTSLFAIAVLFGVQQLLGITSLITYFDLVLNEIADLSLDPRLYNMAFSLLGMVGSMLFVLHSTQPRACVVTLRKAAILMAVLYGVLVVMMEVLDDTNRWLCCVFLTAINLIYSSTWLTLPWLLLVTIFVRDRDCNVIYCAVFFYWFSSLVSMELFAFIANYSLSAVFVHLSVVGVAGYSLVGKFCLT